jgi:hypothetical protein
MSSFEFCDLTWKLNKQQVKFNITLRQMPKVARDWKCFDRTCLKKRVKKQQYLDQACTTYGPRKLLIWLAKPTFMHILALFFDGNTKKIRMNLTNLARKYFSNLFWPAMKSELCIPDLDGITCVT